MRDITRSKVLYDINQTYELVTEPGVCMCKSFKSDSGTVFVPDTEASCSPCMSPKHQSRLGLACSLVELHQS